MELRQRAGAKFDVERVDTDTAGRHPHLTGFGIGGLGDGLVQDRWIAVGVECDGAHDDSFGWVGTATVTMSAGDQVVGEIFSARVSAPIWSAIMRWEMAASAMAVLA